ncbi:hypothetical protein EYF80_043379 [Liparis tanakae]|uniref:Uncharacterized protein n=1 Tax=Liparis tanakae TaxID=230148 RepID=A0A4Z2G0J0_9TELE|nr:hypothetical protein EYF80_043379 [Liparis tanakae]
MTVQVEHEPPSNTPTTGQPMKSLHPDLKGPPEKRQRGTSSERFVDITQVNLAHVRKACLTLCAKALSTEPSD